MTFRRQALKDDAACSGRSRRAMSAGSKPVVGSISTRCPDQGVNPIDHRIVGLVGSSMDCESEDRAGGWISHLVAGSNPAPPFYFGPVAQRLEQATHNRLVHGSNPGRPINLQNEIAIN